MGESRTWVSVAGGLSRAALALWVCLFPVSAAGQLAAGGTGNGSPLLSPRGFDVGVGLRRTSRADALVSPLRYRGFSWSLSVGAELATTTTIKRISLAYSPPSLTSSATRHGSHVQRGHWGGMEATLFHRIVGLGNGNLTLHLGGTLTAQGSLYEHAYERDDTETWAQFFGLLEPGVAWHLHLPGGAVLWQEITTPLAGFVARPPYQGLTEMPSPSFQGPGRVTGIRQTLHYWRDLGRGWKGGVTYSFQGLRYPAPRPLAQTQHALTVHMILWGGEP